MDSRSEERMRHYLPEKTFLEQGIIIQQNVLLEGQALRQKEPEYEEQLQVNNACYEHQNNMPKLDQEIEKRQDKVMETEVESQNVIEEEITSLKYQDLDEVLRGEINQISMVLENQLAKLSMLEKAHKDIFGENTEIKEYISEVKALNKQLNESIQQSEIETGNVYQTVQHHENVIQQLKECVKIFKKEREIIESRTKEFYESAKKLENKVKDWKSISSTKISDLRDKIEAKKRSIAALNNNDDMTNKKIAEIRERRPGLETRYQEALRKLEQEKEKVEELQARNTEILDKTEIVKVEISNLEDPSEHLLKAKERKIAAEKDKQLLLNKLEIIRGEYDEKMEEKSSLLTKKYELEKCQLEQDSKSSSLRVLDESIEIQKRKIDELDQKIATLEHDDKLEKILKEKAYLEASNNYIEQKYNKTNTEAESMSNKVENLRKENTNIKEKIEEKMKELSKINSAIEMRKGDGQSTFRPNSGILKPTQRPKSPVSPKKVTFTGVPSSESSSDVNAPQTIQGNVFDQMLAEFRIRRPPPHED